MGRGVNAGISQDNSFICAAPDADEHSEAVAGIIICSNTLPPGARGISPGAHLIAGGSCLGVLNELQTVTTNLINLGARVINQSWQFDNGTTQLTNDDRFYDSRVFIDRRLMVAAAGNRGVPCAADGRITTPGKAYNGITVGAFNDFNNSGLGW